MLKPRVLLAVLLMSAAATAQGAPPTRQEDRPQTFHGQPVHDPYRWLEEARSPEVQAWIEAQNACTESTLNRFPEGSWIRQRVMQLSMTSPRRSAPQLQGGQLFYLRDTPPDPQPVLVAQAWPEGADRVLVDPNRKKAGAAILDFWPSPSGHQVAYSSAVGGTELATLHVVDATTGRLLADELVDTAGGTTPASLAWDQDERGFTYVRLPDPRHPFDALLMHHRLGTPPTQDVEEFGRDLSSVAEWSLSSQGKRAAALVQFGDGSPFLVYLRGAEGWKQALGAEADVRQGGHWRGQELLVVAGGSVRSLGPDGKARTLLEGGWGAIHEVYPLGKGLLVSRCWGAEQRLEHYDASGELVRTVALPGEGLSISGVASSDQSVSALIAYEGWSTPPAWVRYDGESGQLTPIFSVQAPPTAEASLGRVRIAREEAVSSDGARVPLTVLSLEGTPRDGHRPTILTAYGGFGVNTVPRFLGAQLAWLERGGVLAVANIRGGAEFGESWHQQGMLLHKQQCFDDFAACARQLQSSGWTDRDHLGIQGGSNGGLLMGASLTQHPELFRAVIGFVGLYDMIRSQLWPNGVFNITEFGSVADLSQFEALFGYSPYHQVRSGVAYPSVLLETGENDPRVAPWQSRKFAAALQAATSSGRPVLLLTRRNAGHGQGASFSQRVGKTALSLTFFAHELGLPVEAVGRP